MCEHLDHKHSQGLAGALYLVLNTRNGVRPGCFYSLVKGFPFCRKSLKVPQAYSTGSDGVQLEWSVNFRKEKKILAMK